MAFDECTPYPCNYNYAKKINAYGHIDGLKRCIEEFNSKRSFVWLFSGHFFPIIQGSVL